MRPFTARRAARRRWDEHEIVAGTVSCPVRTGAVDVERCVACSAFRGFSDRDGLGLRCRPVGVDEPAFVLPD